MIPVSDPGASYRALKGPIDGAVARVLSSGRYILGEEVTGFEREFRAWMGGLDCVGCASGTDALVLALRALGVGEGDQVATVSHTSIATVAAIELCGAEAVLVDVDARRYTMAPSALQALLSRGKGRLKAVLAVHLYGQMADVAALRALCDLHGLLLVEDCAQAHGARLQDRPAGAWGHAAGFSFYPTKNLGALGDAGAAVFASSAAADEARSLRQFGWRQRYVSERRGFNSRLDELQAAVLRAKLPHLDAANARRCEIAAVYDRVLKDLEWILPLGGAGNEHVYHQYVIRGPRRDELALHMRSRGVASAVLYPVPIHLQTAYRGHIAVAAEGLPNTEALAGEILSLPMHPQLTAVEVDLICSVLRAFT